MAPESARWRAIWGLLRRVREPMAGRPRRGLEPRRPGRSCRFLGRKARQHVGRCLLAVNHWHIAPYANNREAADLRRAFSVLTIWPTRDIISGSGKRRGFSSQQHPFPVVATRRCEGCNASSQVHPGRRSSALAGFAQTGLPARESRLSCGPSSGACGNEARPPGSVLLGRGIELASLIAALRSMA